MSFENSSIIREIKAKKGLIGAIENEFDLKALNEVNMMRIIISGLFIYLLLVSVFFFEHSSYFIHWLGIIIACTTSGIMLGSLLGSVHLAEQDQNR